MKSRWSNIVQNQLIQHIGIMKISIDKDKLKKLTPVLSNTEKQEILAYYTIYEKYADEFSKKAMADLKNHPIFGKLIRDIPREVSKRSEELSRALQKDAILNENWQPYIEYQIEQGIAYAKMGLDFISWYEVVALAKNYISPYLYREYGNGEKLFSSLNGMSRFMDIAMGIIGEAYMQAKEEIIQEDQEKIKKLNEELEQKVIERTSQLEINMQKLLESEEKLRVVLDSAQIGAWDLNLVEDTAWRSLLHDQLFGYDHILPEWGYEIFVKHVIPEDREYVKQRFEEAFTKGKFNMECRIKRVNDNSIRWISAQGLAYKNEKGELTKMMGIVFDINERKKAEEQLKAVNKELEAFSYSVSHDLRAPLRAVNGYAEMLNEDYEAELDEEGKRIIQAIRYNTAKMGTLIDDLLAFSQLGRKEMKKTKIDMNELTEGVLSEMNKSVSHKAKISIGELQSVKADYGLLHQVMFNLISNAIKYSSKKENPIVEIFSEMKDGEIIFSVKDNGAGFDMKYADKLFGVFQRLHSQEEFEGTGVGLAIVQRVIAKHSGRIWAEGKVNEGATFKFSLTIN